MTNGLPDRLVNFDFSPVFRERLVCFFFLPVATALAASGRP
jgi:hypothetical protein